MEKIVKLILSICLVLCIGLNNFMPIVANETNQIQTSIADRDTTPEEIELIIEKIIY